MRVRLTQEVYWSFAAGERAAAMIMLEKYKSCGFVVVDSYLDPDPDEVGWVMMKKQSTTTRSLRQYIAG